MPGSALEGHRSPSGGWYLELFTRVLDLYERYGSPFLTEDIQSDLALIRGDLATHPDGAGDMRRTIAVEGHWPAV
jgi:hypothetical protein